MKTSSNSKSIVRTFRDLRDSDTSTLAYDVGWDFGVQQGMLKWSDVLASKRVLLVSEAGAGKTFECEAEAERLAAEGHPAFFLRLERVAKVGVRDALPLKLKRVFDEWVASSNKQAYFFLDSVDELLLTDRTFREALEQVASELSELLSRCVFVVTSRPIDIDRVAFKTLLPVPPRIRALPGSEEFVLIATRGMKREGPAEVPEYRELKLLSLTDEQVLEFAQLQGIADPNAMWAAIKQRNAQDFARWPQELIELCDSWRDNGCISNYLDQIEFHVKTRLNARTNRREKVELSPLQAREGAQKIALAAILGRRLTIRISAGADRYASVNAALDPRVVLPDWSVQSISTLLQRPIFVEGGDYGRARFRHRSIMEYLAACQIRDMLKAGRLSLAASNRLLFGLGEGNEKVLKPSMRPIAGWLAMFRAHTFDTVLREEPSALLIYGDPESLTVHQKERALLAFVERYGKGQWRGLHVPELQLERLADGALAKPILVAWQSNIENPEVRQLLLKLIGLGGLAQCADLAATVAGCKDSTDSERFEALLALTKLGDPRFVKEVEAAVSLSSGWNERTRRWVCTLMYPDYVSDEQMLHVLAMHKEERRNLGDLARGIARRIDQGALSEERQLAILPRLIALTRNALEWKDGDLQERKGRLGISVVLKVLCIQLLKSGYTEDSLLEASALAIRSADQSYGGRRDTELRDLVRNVPQEKRCRVLKADLEIARRDRRNTEPRALAARVLYQGSLFYSVMSDFEWMLALLRSGGEAHAVKEVVLRMAVNLTSDDPVNLGALREAVSETLDFATLLEELVESSQPTAELLEMQREHRKREQRQRERSLDEQKFWREFWTELASRSSLALSPGRVRSTLLKLGEVLGNMDQAGDGRWDRPFLVQNFGPAATDAIRQAMMDYWRSMQPTLRSERSEDQKGITLVVWSIGLMGIYAEAEDPTWVERLTSAEANLAARYALLELNGFPSWLAGLSKRHPKAVKDALIVDLADEISAVTVDGRWHSILLQNLRYGSAEIAKPYLHDLVFWLENSGAALMSAPHNTNNEAKIDQVVRVLLVHGDARTHAWLEDLAEQRVASSLSAAYLVFWMPVLVRLNPRRGSERLLSKLAELPVQKEGVAVQLIGSLFSERHPESAVDWAVIVDARTLLALCKQFHRHVRQSDDTIHETAYSPGTRDWAESGRRILFDSLMKCAGPHAMECKLELAQSPLFRHVRDRIVALAQERFAAELDTSTWSETEVCGLLIDRDLTPKTVSDMAQLLVDRLDDLKEYVLSDVAPRKGWAMITDENAFRPVIAGYFDANARGAYSVEQESVTVDGKEVDVRLTSPFGPKATIELKIGEKPRTAKELIDTIQDQLVTKYMAHNMAKAGCLLVTVADPEKSWRHPVTRKAIGREELQHLLDEAAREAQFGLGGEARVVARILDLTPRLPTEVEARRASASRRRKVGTAVKGPAGRTRKRAS